MLVCDYASGMQPAQVLHDKSVLSYSSDKVFCYMAVGSLMIIAVQDSKFAEMMPESQLAGSAAFYVPRHYCIMCAMQLTQQLQFSTLN